MRKIILINNALTSGGAERFIAEMANYMDNSGIETIILLLRRSDVHFEINKKIKIIEPVFFKTKSKISKLFYFIYLFFYLRKHVREEKADMVFNLAYPTFVLWAIGNLISVFISIRCDPNKTALIEGVKMPLFIRRLFYSRSKGIIAQTEDAAKVLANQFEKNSIAIIPNYISNQYTQEFNLLTEKQNHILFVGRLIKSKGIIYLLNAFASLDNKNWTLDIVGDGPEKKMIADFIKTHELADRIILHGNQKNVYTFYERSKIFVLPSLSEGFPNVLLEAMSMGCACVSFKCNYGPADIIQNRDNGILVDVANQNELSLAIQYLIDNNEEITRLMLNARSVRENYNIERIMNKFISVFEYVN